MEEGELLKRMVKEGLTEEMALEQRFEQRLKELEGKPYGPVKEQCCKQRQQ